MKLYVKYMVSNRCKMLVKSELKKLGLQYKGLKIGEIEVTEQITDEQRSKLKIALAKSGFELLDKNKAELIEKIKTAVMEMVEFSDGLPRKNNSVYISEKLEHDYTYLSNLFSASMGVTLEQYIIAHKIERAKELLIYNELTLTEISYRLNYSSVAHLSNQFKKVTGLKPSLFKMQITDEQRKILKIDLSKSPFNFLDKNKAELIEKIKAVIIEMVHFASELPRKNSSVYLSEKLQHDYTYLANLFSKSMGLTLEQYIIAHKIERAKELLLYNDLTLTEISYRLNYSSVAHLSNQFRKVTGLKPSFFKELKYKRRKISENV